MSCKWSIRPDDRALRARYRDYLRPEYKLSWNLYVLQPFQFKYTVLTARERLSLRFYLQIERRKLTNYEKRKSVQVCPNQHVTTRCTTAFVVRVQCISTVPDKERSDSSPSGGLCVFQDSAKRFDFKTLPNLESPLSTWNPLCNLVQMKISKISDYYEVRLFGFACFINHIWTPLSQVGG